MTKNFEFMAGRVLCLIVTASIFNDENNLNHEFLMLSLNIYLGMVQGNREGADGLPVKDHRALTRMDPTGTC